jgi:RHS repeat-associated protein
VTSGTASVVNHIVYDAFGKTVSETDTAIAHLYGYTGRELDKETGLQYNRARYLDLVLARWISHDPKSFAAGDTNLHRYVGNHPSYATDPSGLFKVGDGHHIIPQELWKSFDTTITDVWDTVTARIRDDYYNFHDGVTINGVSHAQYNAAVASELEKFAKGKSMNPELAQKFLDKIKGSENKIIKAFNDGVRQEVALAAQIGEAEYRKRMSKFTPKTQAYSEARDTAFEAARAAAELEVKKRRGTAAAELSKIANRLSKLDGAIGYAKRGLGYVARHTPILVGGFVYYTTGDVNQALAESTPLSWSLEGGRAIGSFYEYAQDEIEETAFENRYSERWYMGSAHSRQGAYDHAKAARDAAKGR